MTASPAVKAGAAALAASAAASAAAAAAAAASTAAAATSAAAASPPGSRLALKSAPKGAGGSGARAPRRTVWGTERLLPVVPCPA